MSWAYFVLAMYIATSALAYSCDSRSTRKDSPPADTSDLPERADQTADQPPFHVSAVDDSASSLVDLLRVTPAVVAVSSRSALPRDFPEHLVDGKPETAWKTRSGEVTGAWVAFRVPSDAYVSHVLMSAGFERRTDARDFFTEGPRIQSIRVYRYNRRLRDVVLDPSIREPQRIEIGERGGDYKLMVTSVVDGSSHPARELAVSRFAVMGAPGATTRAHSKAPPVRLGQLGATDVSRTSYVLDLSSTTACDELRRFSDEALDEDRASPWRLGSPPPMATRCSVSPAALAPPVGGFTEISALDVDQDLVGPDGATFHGALLGVGIPGGFARTDLRIRGEERSLSAHVGYALLGVDFVRANGASKLVVQVVETRREDDDANAKPTSKWGAGREEKAHVGIVCSREAQSVSCNTTRTRIMGNRARSLTTRVPTLVSDAGDVSFDVQP